MAAHLFCKQEGARFDSAIRLLLAEMASVSVRCCRWHTDLVSQWVGIVPQYRLLTFLDN